MKKSPTHIATDGSDPRRSFLRLALGAGAGAVVGGGLLAACGGGDPEPEIADGRAQPLNVTTTCVPASYPVISPAGATIGTMAVSNTPTTLNLNFTAAAGCAMTEIYVWVGNDLANVPTNVYDNADISAFPYKRVVASPGSSFELSLPLDSISLPSDPCQGPLYILTKVFADCGYGWPTGTGTYQNFPYIAYQLCGLDCTVLNGCETAFAKGGYVFASDVRANPEGLTSLALTRNRWGWAIRRGSIGTTVHNVYAGAGLNDISRATLVGTVSIAWNGTMASVTYSLATGVVMTEAHLYARTSVPTTIAPGQYGHVASFPTPAASHTFTVPVSGSVAWFIVHAVVC
jgi:hypothetical protein